MKKITNLTASNSFKTPFTKGTAREQKHYKHHNHQKLHKLQKHNLL